MAKTKAERRRTAERRIQHPRKEESHIRVGKWLWPAIVAAVAAGVPNENELVTTVALAIVVTLLLQTTTKPWLARRLGLHEPDS